MLINSDFNILYYIIIEVLLGISIITIIVLSSVKMSSLQPSLRSVNDINSNWFESPVLEIANGPNCIDGFTNFIEEKWKGTNAGCNCVGIWSYRVDIGRRNQLNIGQCSYNETLGGCAQVRSILPVNYNYYKGTILCVKKANYAYNDILNSVAPPKKSCLNGKKPCGIIDTFGNTLCLERDKQCPINKIIFQNNAQPDPKDFNYKKITLSNTNLFYTNEAVTNRILLEIIFSEGQVCVDPLNKNTMYPQQYKLDVDYYNYGCTTKINGITYDSRFTKMDSILKQDLFYQNGINQILNYLPFYPISNLNANVDLYMRSFIGWDSRCLGAKLEDPQIVTIIANKISSSSTLQIVNIVLSSILLVYFIAHIVLKFTYKNHLVCFNILEVFVIVFSIVILIICFVLVGNNSGFTNLKTFSCGDEITNAIFVNIGEIINKSSNNDRIILIFSMYNTFVYIAHLFVQICRKSNCFNHLYSVKLENLPNDSKLNDSNVGNVEPSIKSQSLNGNYNISDLHPNIIPQINNINYSGQSSYNNQDYKSEIHKQFNYNNQQIHSHPENKGNAYLSQNIAYTPENPQNYNYPSKNNIYPSQNSAYPSLNNVNTAQNLDYASQNSVYPSHNIACDPQNNHYPSVNNLYNSQNNCNYPYQNNDYPSQNNANATIPIDTFEIITQIDK